VAFRVAFRLLRSREDAEDVSQEAMIRAMERFESLRDRHRFRAWLVRMAWRLAIDRRRSDWRRAGRDTHLVSTGIVEADAEVDLIQRQRAAHIQAAVDQLPAKLRAPFVLANVEGRRLDEVAALLHLPSGTVKSRTFQARQRLRRTLVKSGVVIALAGWATVTFQRIPFGERVSVPDVAPIEFALAAPIPSAHVAVNAIVPSAPPADPGPVVASSTPVVKVPTIEIPLVTIPIVNTRVVQIPVVEVPTNTVSTIGMEKQR